MEVIRILDVVWVYILRTSIGPIRVLRPDGRLLPSIGSGIAQCCYTTANRPRVLGECSYGKSWRECECLVLALSGVAASDVDMCETSSGVPACWKTTALLPLPGFELGSHASEPRIINSGPVVRLGQQPQHCERMNNPDNSRLRPRTRGTKDSGARYTAP